MAGKDGVRKKALKIASGWDEIFEDLTSLKEQAVEQDKRYHEQTFLVQRVDELTRRIEQLEAKLDRNTETVQSMRADNQQLMAANDRHEHDIREIRYTAQESAHRVRDDYTMRYQSLERRIDQLEQILKQDMLIGAGSRSELSSLLKSMHEFVNQQNRDQRSLLESESQDNLETFKKLPKPSA